jgi:phosphopantetheinyl transferase
MPIRTDKHIDEHSRLVVWEIEETPEWFLTQLHLDEEELAKYNGFRTDQRRVHWLAYRYILKNVVGMEKSVRVRYDQHSKPFIDLSDEHISVTHSGKFAGVILSKKYPVGIDVEEVNQRLHKVGDKFLSRDETGQAIETMSTEQLCIHWCAKEALYKLYGERKLDFKSHIRIGRLPDKLEGDFKGMIHTGKQENHFRLQVEKLDNYYLVYVIASHSLKADKL